MAKKKGGRGGGGTPKKQGSTPSLAASDAGEVQDALPIDGGSPAASDLSELHALRTQNAALLSETESLRAQLTEIEELRAQLPARDQHIAELQQQVAALQQQQQQQSTGERDKPAGGSANGGGSGEDVAALAGRLESLKKQQREADLARDEAWAELKRCVADISKLAAADPEAEAAA